MIGHDALRSCVEAMPASPSESREFVVIPAVCPHFSPTGCFSRRTDPGRSITCAWRDTVGRRVRIERCAGTTGALGSLTPRSILRTHGSPSAALGRSRSTPTPVSAARATRRRTSTRVSLACLETRRCQRHALAGMRTSAHQSLIGQRIHGWLTLLGYGPRQRSQAPPGAAPSPHSTPRPEHRVPRHGATRV